MACTFTWLFIAKAYYSLPQQLLTHTFNRLPLPLTITFTLYRLTFTLIRTLYTYSFYPYPYPYCYVPFTFIRTFTGSLPFHTLAFTHTISLLFTLSLRVNCARNPSHMIIRIQFTESFQKSASNLGLVTSVFSVGRYPYAGNQGNG